MTNIPDFGQNLYLPPRYLKNKLQIFTFTSLFLLRAKTDFKALSKYLLTDRCMDTNNITYTLLFDPIHLPTPNVVQK